MFYALLVFSVFCSAGKEYTESGTCMPCEVGFFKNTVGNDQECTICPLGYTTDGPGQASCELCKLALFVIHNYCILS